MDRQLMVPLFVLHFGTWVALGARTAGAAPMVSGIPQLDIQEALGKTEGKKEYERNYEVVVGPFNKLTLDEQARFGQCIGNNLTYVYLNAPTEPGHNNRVAKDGIQNIFYGMVLSSYAAFEALATDLWVETVNLAPGSYAGQKGNKSEKPISVADIEEFGYDLRGRMGEFLRTSGRVNFQSLGGIEDAYKSTFKDAYKPDKNLSRTSNVRHLIAHRSGRDDNKFKDDMKAWPEYANLRFRRDTKSANKFAHSK